MNGAASGLIEAFKDYATAHPGWDDNWLQIPSGGTSWYKYGGGGINSWGTLCGVPNGCCAVLNLIGIYGVHPYGSSTILADQVLGYYSTTLFPPDNIWAMYDAGWTPASPAPVPIPNGEVQQTLSYSPLCHVSISRFLTANDATLYDSYTDGDGTRNLKQDRCGKMCAEMAGRTAELINSYIESTILPDLWGMPDGISPGQEYGDCLDCHLTGTSPRKDEVGKMDCSPCHTPDTYHLGVDRMTVISMYTCDGGGSPSSAFSAGDTIQYHVEYSLLGPGACYMWNKAKKLYAGSGDVRFKNVQKGTYWSGPQHLIWTDTIPSGTSGQQKIEFTLKLYNYKGGMLYEKEKGQAFFTVS